MPPATSLPGPPPMCLLWADALCHGNDILAASKWLGLPQANESNHAAARFTRAARMAMFCYGIDPDEYPEEVEQVARLLDPVQRVKNICEAGDVPWEPVTHLSERIKKGQCKIESADDDHAIKREASPHKITGAGDTTDSGSEGDKEVKQETPPYRVLGPDDTTESGSEGDESSSDPVGLPATPSHHGQQTNSSPPAQIVGLTLDDRSASIFQGGKTALDASDPRQADTGSSSSDDTTLWSFIRKRKAKEVRRGANAARRPEPAVGAASPPPSSDPKNNSVTPGKREREAQPGQGSATKRAKTE
ncbi:hypothetical protein PFICI_06485 [Pestalotiopsis fici W106-1]|uniref:Uncharacterized protein n=1 Tax=Pestalotiopsis fici (strain W106-1 / CGMCC3.15140) TaxID=1229662 RepID=W3X5S3_PESFW|nr:uncharacterized protein PFICI_06485 [Pestalotiopsis fici W106-1]ETS81483.1 hypothetical protein PFICI_06485 [Pestalotiopsis fici W106-1]